MQTPGRIVRPRAAKKVTPRESLTNPNASTLTASPFSKASSHSARSKSSSSKNAANTGSTARPPARGIYATGVGTAPAQSSSLVNESQDLDMTGDNDDVSRQLEFVQDEEDADETLIDRLRLARNDSMQQHLYSTAEFWGNKVYELTRDPNDGFWLAQTYFLTLQFARAERVLMVAKPDLSISTPLQQPNGVASTSLAASNSMVTHGKGKEREVTPITNGFTSDDINPPFNAHEPIKLVRLTDLSIACRYLAAQCLIRQQKWAEALDLIGPSNQFAHNSRTLNGPSIRSSDGGIKFEASLCHLRGLIHLHHNSTTKAKESFLEALSLDVKCFESFQSLVDGNLLDVDEEWQVLQALNFKEQLYEEDSDFVRMAYTVRLKKYKNHDEFTRCRERLVKQYGLSEDPDVLYGLADELFLSLRWQDCFAVTSSILSTHPGHTPTLPLHLGCMYHLPILHSRLFLLAHELVEKSADSPISWYAVGLWYYAQKRWDEARRFFGKAVLIDSRFGPAWISFAHAYALEGEHDQAITAYSTAQRHFQGTHLPLLFIGMQHLQLSNHRLGKDYLETAWSMCVVDPLLANEMGVMCFWLGEFQKAVDYLNKALELVKSIQGSRAAWYNTYVNLGHAHRKLQNWAEAEKTFKQATELDPSLPAAHLGLGYILISIGQRDTAIERLHEALARSPGDPVAAELVKVALEDCATYTKLLADHPDTTNTVRFSGLAVETANNLDKETEVMQAEIINNYENEGNGNANESSMAVDDETGQDMTMDVTNA